VIFEFFIERVWTPLKKGSISPTIYAQLLGAQIPKEQKD
jgi:hypothetical protein